MHIFAFHQAGGVPIRPHFQVMRRGRVEPHVLRMMQTERRPTVYVWDWQQDGIRMRVAKMRNRRLQWDIPSVYWLLHGDRD